MALISLTRQQASSGVWVFLGLRTRKACPNTAVCARTAPLLYPVPPLDSGLSIPSLWLPSPFTPDDPFVALGPSWVFVVPVSLLPPPSPFPRTTVRVPIPSLPPEGYFCGRPARPHSAGLPCLGLPDGLDASRTPLRAPPPPHSIAMIVLVRSHPPFRDFCSGLRSVGGPSHGRGPRDQVTALANRGT